MRKGGGEKKYRRTEKKRRKKGIAKKERVNEKKQGAPFFSVHHWFLLLRGNKNVISGTSYLTHLWLWEFSPSAGLWYCTVTVCTLHVYVVCFTTLPLDAKPGVQSHGGLNVAPQTTQRVFPEIELGLPRGLGRWVRRGLDRASDREDTHQAGFSFAQNILRQI